MSFTPLPNEISAIGINPEGDESPIPISGIAKTTIQTLAANTQWDSGWMDYFGNTSVRFSLSSDKPGSYAVYYSDDQNTAITFMGNQVNYDPDQVKPFQGALAPKGRFFKFVYMNGPAAQNEFFLEIRFEGVSQPTLRSVGADIGSSNLALVTNGPISATDGSLYGQIGRIGDALKVNVTNSVGTIKIDQTSLDALENINVSVSQASLDALENITVMGTVGINNFPASPSTSTLQTAGNTSLSNIDTDLGTLTDVALTDPTASGSVIAALKGILAQGAATTSNTGLTNTAAANLATTVLNANLSRKGYTINSISGTILIKEGTGASATSYSGRIVTNGYWEGNRDWKGPVTVFSTAAGSIAVVERT